MGISWCLRRKTIEKTILSEEDQSKTVSNLDFDIAKSAEDLLPAKETHQENSDFKKKNTDLIVGGSVDHIDFLNKRKSASDVIFHDYIYIYIYIYIDLEITKKKSKKCQRNS